MKLKKIEIQGIEFFIQSFCQDYCYLVAPIPCKISSIRINFWAFHNNRKQEIFSSNQKTSKNWFDFVSKIDVLTLEYKLKINQNGK
jgi:hypothetical protein